MVCTEDMKSGVGLWHAVIVVSDCQRFMYCIVLNCGDPNFVTNLMI